jgi:hypothetical protein
MDYGNIERVSSHYPHVIGLPLLISHTLIPLTHVKTHKLFTSLSMQTSCYTTMFTQAVNKLSSHCLFPVVVSLRTACSQLLYQAVNNL